MRSRQKRRIAALFGVAVMLFAGLTALGPALADDGEDGTGTEDVDTDSTTSASKSSHSSESSEGDDENGSSLATPDSMDDGKPEAVASSDPSPSASEPSDATLEAASSEDFEGDATPVEDDPGAQEGTTLVVEETDDAPQPAAQSVDGSIADAGAAEDVVDAATEEEAPEKSTGPETLKTPPADEATVIEPSPPQATTTAPSEDQATSEDGPTDVTPATPESGEADSQEEAPEESTETADDEYVGPTEDARDAPGEPATDEEPQEATDEGATDEKDEAREDEDEERDHDDDRDKDAKDDDDDDDDDDRHIFRTVRGGLLLGGFHHGNIFSRHSGFFSDGGLFTLFPTRGLPLRLNPSHEVFGFANRACDGGRFGIGLGDFSSRSVDSSEVRQRVSVDRDSALLAIALANAGVSGVDFNSIRNVDFRAREASSFRQDSRLDRDDVLLALALGIGPRARGLDTLACIADISERTERTVEFSQSLTLNPDTVLLAIAFKNAVGGPLSLQDVANFDQRSRVTERVDRDVDIDREDALNAIALGGGRRS